MKQIHLATPTESTSKMVDKVLVRRDRVESKPGRKIKRYEVIDQLVKLGFIFDRAIVLMKAGRVEAAQKLLEKTIEKHLAA